MTMKLFSVYTEPRVQQAWKGAVKALGRKQGPALDEALRLYMEKYRTEIEAAQALPTPAVKVAS